MYRKLNQKKRFIVCIDFDGTITMSDKVPYEMKLRPNVKEALDKIKALGGIIWIYTARTVPNMIEEIKTKYNVDVIKEMVDCLSKNEIPYDEILYPTKRGKPVYDFIIDDKSCPSFNGDWPGTYDMIEECVNDLEFKSVIEKFGFMKGAR